jgi:hypothetical protein
LALKLCLDILKSNGLSLQTASSLVSIVDKFIKLHIKSCGMGGDERSSGK